MFESSYTRHVFTTSLCWDRTREAPVPAHEDHSGVRGGLRVSFIARNSLRASATNSGKGFWDQTCQKRIEWHQDRTGGQ